MRALLYSAILPALLAIVGVLALGALGDRGILVVIGACASVPLSIAIWKRPDITLLLAIGILIGAPFFLSLTNSPRIYVDQLLLLALYIVMAFKLMLRREATNLRWIDIFPPIAALSLLSVTLFTNPATMGGLRGFIELMLFSMPLCLLSAQIANEHTAAMVAKLLTVMVILLTVGSAVELLYGNNPLMEYAFDRYDGEFPYISAELAAASDGYYRPYVIFVNPSEGGTVIAMCIPFILALWNDEKKFWRVFCRIALFAGAAFILMNATRGVWFSVFVTMFSFLPRFRKGVVLAVPVLVGGLVVASLFFSQTTFWDRVADFRNLRIRFWYWEQAVSLLEGNWLSGLGFGNFSVKYLSHDPVIPIDFAADIQQVMTVDNAFLMVLAENGLVGLAGYLFLIVFLFYRLLTARRLSLARGNHMAATFALAAMASLCIYLLCGFLADVHLFNKATKLVFLLAGLGWGVTLNAQERGRPQ